MAAVAAEDETRPTFRRPNERASLDPNFDVNLMSTYPPANQPEPSDYGAGPTDDRPELGHLAQWTVSSHKYGFGVDNLRDGNEMTFWQSEGPQPHLIDLSFPKRVFVSAVAIQTSHPRDDSYTPSKISIRAGTGLHDLQEVRFVDFKEPNGWMDIPLRPMDSGDDGDVEGPPIPCHHIRIVVLANHLNGKDTHVRGLRVFGVPNPITASFVPRNEGGTPTKGIGSGKRLLELGHDGLSGFTSQKFRMHEFIR